MIDRQKFGIALERVAMGLVSAERQMRPKTAAEGGKAMAYALSVALGAVEMPEDGPMELAWDHWARRKDEGGAQGMAMSVLIQLIPPPIREEDLPLLGQIALWLDMAEYEDAEAPDSDRLAAARGSAEGQLAEQTAGAALDDLIAARDALRACLLSEADSAACQPQREVVAATEQQLDAAAALVAGTL